MCKTLSLNALETGITAELGKYGIVLKDERLSEITSLILYTHVKKANGISSAQVKKLYERIDSGVHDDIEYTLTSRISLDPEEYAFVLQYGSVKHNWVQPPVYIEQAPESIDARPVNTDKVFEDLLEIIDEKSIYHSESFTEDELIEAIRQLKETAYSATTFLDAVVNDYIYQDSIYVKKHNAVFTTVRYPFCTAGKLGMITFDIVHTEEGGCGSYSFSYEGFECDLQDILIYDI